MSATYDKSQKFKFVYSNMHKIHKSGEPHELKGSVAVVKKTQTPQEKLKTNLTVLEALHERLKKMLAELEALVK